jgi:protein-tyrosine-phosphatase
MLAPHREAGSGHHQAVRREPLAGIRRRRKGRQAVGNWQDDIAWLREARPRHILFLCVSNSARSQMAEALARAMAPAGPRFSSAGSSPRRLHPDAVAVLAEIGVYASGLRAKSLDAVDTASVDAVITLCAEEVCPAWLGVATQAHWPLADPATVNDSSARRETFRNVRDELGFRLAALLTAWPATEEPPET